MVYSLRFARDNMCSCNLLRILICIYVIDVTHLVVVTSLLSLTNSISTLSTNHVRISVK
jgi:hypothetical protein